MNTQLGSTMMVVSGCFAHPSAAPVVGHSLAGRAFCKASPRYKVSPMVEMVSLSIDQIQPIARFNFILRLFSFLP